MASPSMSLSTVGWIEAALVKFPPRWSYSQKMDGTYWIGDERAVSVFVQRGPPDSLHSVGDTITLSTDAVAGNGISRAWCSGIDSTMSKGGRAEDSER